MIGWKQQKKKFLPQILSLFNWKCFATPKRQVFCA